MIQIVLILAVAVAALLGIIALEPATFQIARRPGADGLRSNRRLSQLAELVAMGRDRFLDEENLRRANIRNRRRLRMGRQPADRRRTNDNHREPSSRICANQTRVHVRAAARPRRPPVRDHRNPPPPLRLNRTTTEARRLPLRRVGGSG